ncbi:MAG: LamG domain-containing protein, partial [Planctomycetota bacterium]
TEDGNAMMYAYTNDSSPYYAEAYADITDLGVTSNWTVGGLEALTLSFMGDYDNALEDMYVAVRDGSNRTGKVLYDGDPNDMRREWLGFQEWNIELQDFVDDNSVDLTDVDRLIIGLGDKTAGGSGTVWFDNIRLYPPRCVPQLAPSMGSFRYINRYVQEGNFVPDCTVDNYDLWTLAGDWLIRGIGDVTATSASTTGIVGHWTMDDDVGGGSPGVDQARVLDSSGLLNHAYLYEGFHKTTGLPVYGDTGINHSDDFVEGTGALTLDGFINWIEIPNAPNINSNTITVSAWVKPDGMQGDYATYPPIVGSNEPNGFKLCFGSTASYLSGLEWAANNELTYFWTGYAWDLHSELIMPPDLWSFVALVVEPTKGTLYLYDGFEVAASTNHEPHLALPFNDKMYIGAQPNYADASGVYLGCTIDDVYFYDRALPAAEVLDLAGLSGTHSLGLEPWRPDPSNDDKVNFDDYGVMADNWLVELTWP